MNSSLKKTPKKIKEFSIESKIDIDKTLETFQKMDLHYFTIKDFHLPLNIGSSEDVSINQLVDIVEEIAGIKVERNYLLDAPKGVRGRNSDNTLIRELFDWAPNVSLKQGLTETYKWIYQELV